MYKYKYSVRNNFLLLSSNFCMKIEQQFLRENCYANCELGRNLQQLCCNHFSQWRTRGGGGGWIK